VTTIGSLPEDAVLLLIDVQQAFKDPDPAWGLRNNPGAEVRIALLLAAWRRTGRPVIHVHHHSTETGSPLQPGQPGCEAQDIARPAPGEIVMSKNVNSALIGTDLEQHLRTNDVNVLIIVGLTTNYCVSTTARMAGNLGFDTFVVADATATFDCADRDGTIHPAELVHSVSLASLDGEFATVVETDELLDRLIEPRSTGNP